MVFEFQEADNPEGKPDADPIPVAPAVGMVIGDKALLMQSVGFELGLPAVFVGKVTIDAVLLRTWLHPPAICASVTAIVVFAVSIGLAIVTIPVDPVFAIRLPLPVL
jgi:hypothetical protein